MEDKVRDALRRLTEEGDNETLLTLACRYVDADVEQYGASFIIGKGREDDEEPIVLDRDELEQEILDGAEEYINEKYEIDTMVKLYL